MKSKNVLRGLAIAVVLQFGVLAGSAQTNIDLFSGSKTNITLPPGAYIITAFGAPSDSSYVGGGLGAEMSGEFKFSVPTTLTLLVGGSGYSYGGGGAGGGGGSFVVEGSTPLVIAGGGGGGGDVAGGDYGYGGNGNVSTNGGLGSGIGDYSLGGGSGTGSGGGVGGFNFPTYGGSPLGYCGGGGGGFLGNGSGGSDGSGNASTTNGGGSFETGGNGGSSYYYGSGGFGGGGGGGVDGSGLGGLGGGGGGGGYSGGGGGGGGGNGFGEGGEGGNGGGGGSIIGSSAIAILTEVSGTAGPDDPYNGEIIITPVATPLLITTGAAFGFTNGVFGFNVIGPSGSNVVIQASTDLQTWIPLQTNLLGSGPFQFSDTNAPANVRRFYRVGLQ